MRKIIAGRLYDTDTARRIGCHAYGDGRSSEDWEETLYVKRTGEFFIHGEGGAMSRYAEASGPNEWRAGERIMPISYEQARAWAERHASPEEYERAFGVVEDDGVETLHIQLPASLMATVRARAAAAGRSLRDYVTEIINNGIGGESDE